MHAPHYLRNLRDMGPVRRVGLQLLAEGATQSRVARELGVSRTTASNWAASLAGVAPDPERRPAPRAPILPAAQLRKLADRLGGSPRPHGFPNDAWTPARVAVLIEYEFGVACSAAQAWLILDAVRDHPGAACASASLRGPDAVAQPAIAPAPLERLAGVAARPAGCVRNFAWAGGTGYTVACAGGIISTIAEVSK